MVYVSQTCYSCDTYVAYFFNFINDLYDTITFNLWIFLFTLLQATDQQLCSVHKSSKNIFIIFTDNLAGHLVYSYLEARCNTATKIICCIILQINKLTLYMTPTAFNFSSLKVKYCKFHVQYYNSFIHQNLRIIIIHTYYFHSKQRLADCRNRSVAKVIDYSPLQSINFK